MKGIPNNIWDFVLFRFGPRIQSEFNLIPGDVTIFFKLTLNPGHDLILSWPIDTFVGLFESIDLSLINVSISIVVNIVEHTLKYLPLLL